MKRIFIILVTASSLLCGWAKKEEDGEPQRFVLEDQESFYGGWIRIGILKDIETGKSYIMVRVGHVVGLLEIDEE